MVAEAPMSDPSPERSLQWGAEELWERLVPLLPGISVEVVHRIGSTNSALLQRAQVAPNARAEADGAVVRRSVESAAFGRRSVDLQPCLLVAEHQTAGRGRQGRVWQSTAGASLTFSLALPIAASDWSGMSLAVGVALCEALDPSPDLTGRWVGLKWPNDLWLMDGPDEGRKLGGVLIETVSAGTQRLVIVGVGLNVQHFDADPTSTGFASLSEFDENARAPAVLAQVIVPLVEALKGFEAGGFASFADRFAARDLLRGRAVRTTFADVPEGIARGVLPNGALLVETASGVSAVVSGEVSVRLNDSSASQ
jgi:BirA family biotin operon repressor/biotin-[acetyl-CoA-carboxylase] ligase